MKGWMGVTHGCLVVVVLEPIIKRLYRILEDSGITTTTLWLCICSAHGGGVVWGGVG